ncbi:MAG: hypothetical protein M1360_03620 [Candidatus Marsarchaeota archaeon]|jgi:phosphomevalonate kinase|nr:hypothetical protein [Candidatus Marsarchaeota archaeon]
MGAYVEAEAPGKVLWLGGYSVLEGNRALVTTVDTKVHVSAKAIQEKKIVIDAPMLNGSATGSIDEDGSITINTIPELRLLLKSTEMALKYSIALGNKVTGLHITTRNDDLIAYRSVRFAGGTKIIKSGMGSSAALAVATVSAILGLFDSHEIEAAHKIAQIAHSVATEKIGSGFDIAAANFGNIIYRRYSQSLLKDFPEKYTTEDFKRYVKKEWDYRITKVEFPKVFIPVFAHFKDESAITTSMVKSVNRFKEEQPGRYHEIIEEARAGDDEAIDAMGKINIDASRENLELFRNGFERSRMALKTLGEESGTQIEPNDCTSLIEESKKHGAFVAKLPGSGGKDSIAAIALSAEDAENLKRFWSSSGMLEVLNLGISGKGASFTKKIATRAL